MQITSDLKWENNTQYITEKAYTRLWMIKGLKILGCNTQELLYVCIKQIRSVREEAAVVWHSGLTSKSITDIERVQKACLAIILGKKYTKIPKYQNALELTGLVKLSTRRDTLC